MFDLWGYSHLDGLFSFHHLVLNQQSGIYLLKDENKSTIEWVVFNTNYWYKVLHSYYMYVAGIKSTQHNESMHFEFHTIATMSDSPLDSRLENRTFCVSKSIKISGQIKVDHGIVASSPPSTVLGKYLLLIKISANQFVIIVTTNLPMERNNGALVCMSYV